jgi:transcription elongation factor GreA
MDRMTTRDTLPAVLRGEDAADLGPESRERLEVIAHQAADENTLAFVRDECAARLRQPDSSPAVSYLLAAVSAMQGEVASADQTLLRLGERLQKDQKWEPLAAVAERALDLETTGAAARMLIAAHEGLNKDPERIEAIERASEILDDDLDVALLLAVRLADVGELDRRRALLTTLVPRFAAEGRYSGIEEAALEFSEHLYLDGLVVVIESVPRVVQQEAMGEAAQLLGIAFPPLDKAERGGEVVDAIREAARIAAEKGGETAAQPLRKSLAAALRSAHGDRMPDVTTVFATAGIEDPEKPLLVALDQFDRIALLPPGGPVYHGAFGAGRVASNDGADVFIDFGSRKGHRMPFDAAKRTLTTIDEQDLRLLLVTDPKALATMRSEDPGEAVARALMSIGGEADAKRLKLFMVGSGLVPPKEWTAFWRKAKAAAEKHPRIDHSRAFEQVYALHSDEMVASGMNEVTDVPLPPVEPRKPARANLMTLRKFLSQHPNSEAPLKRRFGKFVERVMHDENADPTDRARAGLYFAHWFEDQRHEWSGVLRQLWEQGMVVGDLTSEDEQLALLESAHVVGVEADAVLSGLNSRFSSVRETAERMQAEMDDSGRADLRRTLLEHAPRNPTAAMRLLEEDLAAKEAPADAWRLFWSALSLIEDRPKPSLANKILRWLEPGDAFERMLEGRECPEDMNLRIRVLLRQWRSSDRFLLPALDTIGRLGLSEAVATVHEARRASTEKLFQGVGQQAEDTDIPMMTRATWDKLQKELERLEFELRMTIPQTIQRARELGDLKENAEYHAAKQKQANVSKVVASLQLRLSKARFVEDAEYKDGVAGLGSEVVLESDDRLVTYWILGEGEHHHGDHVVSFQAPVGRALMGRAIGDEVEIGEGPERRRYRIVSMERKIPAAESETHS